MVVDHKYQYDDLTLPPSLVTLNGDKLHHGQNDDALEKYVQY